MRDLSRREFLERTAYTAGLAGMASVLPANLLIQEAARAQATPLPSPANMPIDHFVVVMMENRSFDHYFGWLGDVADATQSQSYTNNSEDMGATGEQVETIHHSELGEGGDKGWQGCGHPDPGHGWNSGRRQRDDGFLADGSGNDIFALTYFNEGELGFIHDAAKAYTLYDRFHCSLMCSTWPNRYYMWSGQSGGRIDNNPPYETLGNQWPNVLDLVQAVGGTGVYYNSDLPFSATFGARGATYTRKLEAYYADCALGTLPNVAIVDPPFRDGGGFDGNSADEHPHGDVRLGQAWMADVVNAFVNSPNYRNGALFIVYDEWGGFFDHVPPAVTPDDRASAVDEENFGLMGFRIPAVVVSPFTRNDTGLRSRVRSNTYGFESILKLIAYRFGFDFPAPFLGPITEHPTYVPGSLGSGKLLRVDAANNIGESFNWENPDPEPVELPDPTYIASRPCAVGGGNLTDESAQAHANDLAELEELADRVGVAVTDGMPHHYFRKPDSVRKALAN
jgi:phospholipase C